MGVERGTEIKKVTCPMINKEVTVELQYVEIITKATKAGKSRKRYIGKECSEHENCYNEERECTLASRGTYDPLESLL